MIDLEPEISTQFDRMPPMDLEAEKALLGSLMLCLSVEEFHRIAKHSTRQHFAQPDHAIIFDALCAIWKKQGRCDAVILLAELRSTGRLVDVGGAAYIAELMNSMPSSAHGEHYAAIVQMKYVLRSCIDISNDILRSAYNPGIGKDGIEIATDGVRRLSELAATGQSGKIIRLSEAISTVISRMDTGEVPRIMTGITGLDHLTGGLPLGKFTQIGGRPGMGKSLLLKQILRNAALKGCHVGLVSIEEGREKIAENCLSAASGIQNNKIAYGNLCREEWDEVYKGAAKLDEIPFFIADNPVKLADVESAITTMAVEHKCQIIGLDYIQCVDGGEQNENREITLVSRTIKSTFKRLGVAGVAAVQLNRQSAQGDGRRPTLKDLRGSGSLEQDGDLILLLHSEDYYRRERGEPMRDGRLEVIVAKNKDGPQGDVPLFISTRTQEVKDWNGLSPDTEIL